MSLANYRVRTKEVSLGGGESFDVRGLSLPDLTTLLDYHGAEARSLFKLFTESSEQGMDLDSVGLITRTMMNTAPDLVARIIALASGEADVFETAKTLPIPVQLDALEKVGNLTFEASGGPKNFLETVIRLLSQTTGSLESLKGLMTG